MGPPRCLMAWVAFNIAMGPPRWLIALVTINFAVGARGWGVGGVGNMRVANESVASKYVKGLNSEVRDFTTWLDRMNSIAQAIHWAPVARYSVDQNCSFRQISSTELRASDAQRIR